MYKSHRILVVMLAIFLLLVANVAAQKPGDINQDGIVNILDIVAVTSNYGKKAEQVVNNPLVSRCNVVKANTNKGEIEEINIFDLIFVTAHLEADIMFLSAPVSAVPTVPTNLESCVRQDEPAAIKKPLDYYADPGSNQIAGVISPCDKEVVFTGDTRIVQEVEWTSINFNGAVVWAPMKDVFWAQSLLPGPEALKNVIFKAPVVETQKGRLITFERRSETWTVDLEKMESFFISKGLDKEVLFILTDEDIQPHSSSCDAPYDWVAVSTQWFGPDPLGVVLHEFAHYLINDCSDSSVRAYKESEDWADRFAEEIYQEALQLGFLISVNGLPVSSPTGQYMPAPHDFLW